MTTSPRLLAPDPIEFGERDVGRDLRFLTPRETQIARLAASRLTSRQIAAGLAISVRTVNNHLATTYIKLGVHSRRDLSALL